MLGAYLLLGAIAGTLAGLLGLGGGLVIVPALFFIFQKQQFAPEITMHLALGTSLASVVFTALSSSYAHHRHGAVRWDALALLAPGVAVGALLGALIADSLPTKVLRIAFGVFECLVAAQMWFALRPRAQRGLPHKFGMLSVGAGIGVLSAVLGIGGGTLTVPFLVWCNVVIHQAVATSAACGLPIALAGSAGFIAAGWQAAQLPAWSSGYVYWPAAAGIIASSTALAPLGAWLAHKLPVQTLRRLFAVVLAIIGLRMLI